MEFGKLIYWDIWSYIFKYCEWGFCMKMKQINKSFLKNIQNVNENFVKNNWDIFGSKWFSYEIDQKILYNIYYQCMNIKNFALKLPKFDLKESFLLYKNDESDFQVINKSKVLRLNKNDYKGTYSKDIIFNNEYGTNNYLIEIPYWICKKTGKKYLITTF